MKKRLVKSEKKKQGEMSLKLWVIEALPFVGMMMLECLDVGLSTLSKVAMSKGMSPFVFVFYSNALGTLILLPTSFIFNRKGRPPITFSILCKIFILSLFGITIVQNCVMAGVNYSSPTLGSAMSQLIPAFTFVLAIIFRMEKLDLRSSKSQIKITGTIVSISGALIIILYKGAPFRVASRDQSQHQPVFISSSTSNWLTGGLFFVIACLSVSIWTTFQAALMKEYPSKMTMLTFYCFFGAIQCSIVSLVAERNIITWKLRPDVELIPIIYSAVFGSVVTYTVSTWCIATKGPVFVALFKPIGIAVAAFLGVLFLGDTLHVGSIVGAIVIVMGFYGVVWAQSKEEKESKVLVEEESNHRLLS